MAEGTDDVAVSADVADTMTWRSAWQDLLPCLMT